MLMRQRQDNDLVLVIGGTGGLGRDICIRLAETWGHLALTYRSNQNAAGTLAAHLEDRARIQTHQLDVTDPTSIRAVLDGLGSDVTLRCVVFASGVDIMQPLMSRISHDQWTHSVETELLGFIRVVTEIIPRFRALGGGEVIALSSFATIRYAVGDALSAVPKAGIEQVMRALASEQGRFGMRVNCVLPGVIDAGLGRKFKDGYWSDETWTSLVDKIPLGAAGTGRDIANAVAFLASDEARYITGQSLVVDGGLHL